MQLPRCPQIQRARAGAEGRSALAGNANKARIIVHPARRGRIKRIGAKGRERESILATCLEAVLGALYLEEGLPGVRRVVGQLAAW